MSTQQTASKPKATSTQPYPTTKSYTKLEELNEHPNRIIESYKLSQIFKRENQKAIFNLKIEPKKMKSQDICIMLEQTNKNQVNIDLGQYTFSSFIFHKNAHTHTNHTIHTNTHTKTIRTKTIFFSFPVFF